MNRAHGVLRARIRHLEAVGAETGERHRHGHLRLRARHELRGGNRGDFRQLRLRVLDDHLRVDREAEGERLRTQQVEGVLLAALQVLHDQSIVSPTVICIVPTVLGSKSMIAVRLALGRVGDETEANESTTVEYVSTPNTPVASNTNEAEDEVSMGRCTSKAITFVPSCTPEVV